MLSLPEVTCELADPLQAAEVEVEAAAAKSVGLASVEIRNKVEAAQPLLKLDGIHASEPADPSQAVASARAAARAEAAEAQEVTAAVAKAEARAAEAEAAVAKAEVRALAAEAELAAAKADGCQKCQIS